MLHLLIFFLLQTKVNCDYVYGDKSLRFDVFENFINYNFNPDEYLNVPQIIRRHGYPVETHLVETSDGYLLGLHRIPRAKNGTKGRQPVLLQHGLFGSSADWILNGNNSLGFILADQGYDVWLGNDRGNTYSKAHVSLPPWSEQYWNFSWHEMGINDLPAVIYYISNVTGKPGELIYIGHSMGTTQFFVLSSTLPAVAKHVKLMVAFAPTAYMTHLTSPIRYLAPFSNDFQWILEHLGVKELLPNNKFFKLVAYECEKTKDKKFCENIALLICGADAKEINVDLLPTIFSHDPAGSSVKSVIHYAQEIHNKGQFQNFDYGSKGNIIQYGTPTPPLYALKNINTPIYFYYAQNDMLTNYIDVLRLSRKLPDLVGLYKIPIQNFGHLEFIFGKDAYEVLYKPVLKVLRNYTDYS